MRFLTACVLAFSCLFSSLATAQQTPVPMTSNLDPRLKDILQVVVSSVVGRIPGIIPEGTNFVVNDSTVLGQGAIDGTLNMQIGAPTGDSEIKPTPLFASQAQVAIRFYHAPSEEKALLNISTVGQLSTPDFIQFVGLLNQGICTTPTSCTAAPVVDAADSALPISQQGKLAVERFKANMLAQIDAVLATSAGDEPQQSFGTPTEDTSATVDVEKLKTLRTAVEAGLQITASGADAVALIDMNALRALSADLSKINPTLGALKMFSTIQFNVSESAATYTLVIESEIAKNLIVNYDAYIQQEQASDGLESLHNLVMKITWWATGRCTNKKYQEMCINKLLNSCASSVRSVGRCVTEATLVQKAREFKNLLGIGN